MSEDSNVSFTDREALFYHKTIRPGKIEIIASKLGDNAGITGGAVLARARAR